MREYKRKDYLDYKGDENSNLEQGVKSMLFLQPTKTKAKRDMSNVCNFLMEEGLEKDKKTNQNNLRYGECWNKISYINPINMYTNK